MFLRKLTIPFIILVLLVISTNFVIQPLTIKAQENKSSLTEKLNVINEEIEKAKKEFNNLENQKKDLLEQVTTTKAEMAKIEKLLKETQDVITELAVKIPITQNKIKSLETQIYKLYKEIQFSSVTSKAEVLLTSKNFGDFVTKLYGLGAIQDEAEKISGELKDALKQLEDEKKAQEKLLRQQSDTKYILNSKKSYLDNLILDTENKQEEYDKKIKAQSESAAKVQDQISLLPTELRNYIYNNGGNPNFIGDDTSPCYFYESRALVTTEGYFVSPTQGAFTDNFSCYPRSFSWRRGGHDGIDIANATGTPIFSTAPGTVEKIYTNYAAGLGLVIKHELPSGQRVYSVYWHLAVVPNLRIGQEVERGQAVAIMGNSGYSTGPHLHFMLVSDTYEQYGPFCASNGRSKCYNPAKIIGL